ncbi:MAG: hypothetical protein K0S65_1443 [Labilithrix sp.]|nr:hypothetical protein [Labilithrix sp.]
MSIDEDGARRRSVFFTDSAGVTCVAEICVGRKDVTFELQIRRIRKAPFATDDFEPVNEVVSFAEFHPDVTKDKPATIALTMKPTSLDQEGKLKEDQEAPFAPGSYVCEVSLDGEKQKEAPPSSSSRVRRARASTPSAPSAPRAGPPAIRNRPARVPRKAGSAIEPAAPDQEASEDHLRRRAAHDVAHRCRGGRVRRGLHLRRGRVRRWRSPHGGTYRVRLDRGTTDRDNADLDEHIHVDAERLRLAIAGHGHARQLTQPSHAARRAL